MASETERQKSRVFLVADHPLVREHLTALLRREADLEVCGEAADGLTALSLLSREEPDLVILDVSLKRSHGLKLLKDLKEVQPKLPVLVVSMHDETLYAERSLRAGAMGFITKEEATVNVLVAVRKVLAGQVYVSERTAERMMQKKVNGAIGELGSPLEVLTEREWEVFERIGRGMGTRQMAEQLRLGIKTVESYRARIREKLQLNDGNQLLQCAIRWVQKSEGRASGIAAITSETGGIPCN
jgi:DNA-binding NarL/FixJ family response regulator